MSRFAARRPSFTRGELVLTVIVIGLMAAIVVPQFTGGAADARRSALRGQLITLRRQVDLYRREHGGVPPDLIARQWEPLMVRTDSSGAPDPAHGPFGPYLEAMPTNPLNGNRRVSASAGADVGWVYDAATGELRATDRTGMALFEEGSARERGSELQRQPPHLSRTLPAGAA